MFAMRHGGGGGLCHLGRIANMLYIARRLGLAANLKLCLDAGDAASLPVSSTKWLDLSGNGYDFFLGTTASAQATDPTINGTAGRLSSGEYLSFDGGDFLTYDTTAETWMQNIHKDNAKFTLCAWVYLTDVGNYNALCGDVFDTTANTGFSYEATNNTGNPRLLVLRNGTALSTASSLSATANKWQFHWISMDEAQGNLTFGIDGSVDAKTGQVYSSPSSGNASKPFCIASRGMLRGTPVPA